jgi:hypothetical protein
MNTLNTFRFYFEADPDFPVFRRLAREIVEVPVRDVLTRGIHPWTVNSNGADGHPSLTGAFLDRLNAPGVKVAVLDAARYSHDISQLPWNGYGRKSRFEQMLDRIRDQVRFADDLTYPRLLAIARERLAARWDHRLARRLAESACPGFQELRRFLKSKDPKIRLSGYDDIDSYDLGRVLSLDDFRGRDELLIMQALPVTNFRKTAFLADVTDEAGRLRLTPAIDTLRLALARDAPDYLYMHWRVAREGGVWRCWPELGNDREKRRRARAFAEAWREDEGRLCFRLGLDGLVRMIGSGVVTPSFPTLSYTFAQRRPPAAARRRRLGKTSVLFPGISCRAGDVQSGADAFQPVSPARGR